MRKICWLVPLVLVLCFGFVFAQDSAPVEEGVTAPAAATTSFDLNLLWKGALVGLIAALLRFASKAKNPKEFDWKYLLYYGGVGVLAGAYSAWRGLQVDDVLSWLEASGIVLAMWTVLKTGKEGVPKAVVGVLKMILADKKSGGDAPADPPAPPPPTP
jgi:hypothetical protein